MAILNRVIPCSQFFEFLGEFFFHSKYCSEVSKNNCGFFLRKLELSFPKWRTEFSDFAQKKPDSAKRFEGFTLSSVHKEWLSFVNYPIMK